MHQVRSVCILLITAIFCFYTSALAEVEIVDSRSLALDANPIDIATTADGSYTFILAKGGKVFIIDRSGQIKDTLNVDASVDSIETSPQGDYLLLAKNKEKELKLIKIAYVVDIDISGLPFKGPADAPVVMTVFSDYQWPYCAKVEPLLEQVLEQYPNDVKLVFKNFPLTRIHKFAMSAAIAALAANQQGKFWDYHSLLLKNYNKLNDAKFEEIAKTLGLDLEQFKKDMKNPALAAMVQRDMQDGIEVGVRGTPAVYINGRMLQTRSLPGFKQMIDDELAKKKK